MISVAQKRKGVIACGGAGENGLRRPHENDLTGGKERRIGAPQTSESNSKITAFNQTSLKHHCYPSRIDKAPVLAAFTSIM